jgi:amino acid adenylation domain-containing protein
MIPNRSIPNRYPPVADSPPAGAPATDVEAILPLSPLQEGMLFHAIDSQGMDPHLIQLCSTIRGDLDVATLRAAWESVVRTHSALRTVFVWERRDRPLQVIRRTAAPPWEEHDWRALPAATHAAQLERFLAADRERGFSLAKLPPFRIRLIALSDRDYRLIVTYHHIILDGWSWAMVSQQVFAVYQAGRIPETRAPGSQYKDYISWLGRQNSSLAEPFWRHTLKGLREPPLFRVPPAHIPADTPGFNDLELELPERETAALCSFARANHLSLNTLIQAAWALVLRLHHQSDDVVFGMTVSGRSSGPAGCESIVGLLINTLPVRVRIPPGDDTIPWLRQVQTQLFEMLLHEHTSLTEIRGWSELPVSGPFFDSIVVFENYPIDRIHAGLGPNLTIDAVTVVEATSYPLTIAVSQGKCLVVKATYDAQRFTARQIEQFLRHYCAALVSLSASGSRPVREISLLTEQERQALRVAWKASAAAGPPVGFVHELVEAQTDRTPDAIAVECGERRLTYREFDQGANRLARQLRKMGVVPEVRVGLSLERSCNMIVAILAVLKAGGVYVPLDSSHPPERLAAMASDAGLRFVLTDARMRPRFRDLGCDAYCLESLENDLQKQPDTRPVNGVIPGNLAYVMYTSGSAGAPKGVMVCHKALCNFAFSSARRLAIGRADRLLQFASIGFDASVEEIFSCLAGGATLVVPAEMDLEPRAFWRTCRDLRISVLDLPTAYWRLLAGEFERRECDLTGVRLVIIGGEQAQAAPWFAWRRRIQTAARLVNTYGPTETTVVATAFDEISSASQEIRATEPPIGWPIANTSVFLLDRCGEPVPIGAPGEIFIGGTGVALGYLGGARLTAERFVPDPFGPDPGSRLYRTGDFARSRPDGALEFIGRQDRQLKVRGFRIEPGEIETVLAQHQGVREAVVVAREAETGDKRLEAFVVARRLPGPEAPDARDLREYLRRRLPAYMMPAAIEMLSELPLSPNGKIDRRRLPAAGGPPATANGNPHAAPRTPVEDVLAAIWSEVLHADRVAIDDNFFDLGGHSLLAIQVLSRIRAAFRCELPMRALFEEPTLSALARRIERESYGPAWGEEIPLRATGLQENTPLAVDQHQIWAHNQSLPNAAFFNLGGALRLAGPLDRQALIAALSEITRRHQALRTTFPEMAGRAVQRILKNQKMALEVTDFSPLPEAERDATAVRAIVAEAYRPFNLTHVAPLHVSLIELAPLDHILLLTMHHIMADGWSVRIFLAELTVLYEFCLSGLPSPLPELAIQYQDFTVWQELWLKSAAATREIEYWKKQLAGLPALIFPEERPAPAVRTFRFGRREITVQGAHWTAVRQMSRAEGVTVFITLLAALGTVLHRHTGAGDFGIATQTANRNRIELEPLIGLFANTLLLRIDVSGDPTIREMLRRARTTTLEACAHASLPFDYLTEVLANAASPGPAPPDSRILFTLENAPLHMARLAGLEVTLLRLPTAPGEVILTAYDIIIQAEDRMDALTATIQFNTSLFDETMIDGLVARYVRLLQLLPARVDARLSAIEFSGGVRE